MFDKAYKFQGRHAVRVSKLTSVFDNLGTAKIFDKNIDLYVNAPLIGFLFNRRAEIDEEKNPDTGQIFTQNISKENVTYAKEDLTFNFRLIMLLDKNHEHDLQKRINRAFRDFGKDQADIERFDSYVRGGVDVLFEKLIEQGEDRTFNLYTFVDEFENRFNKSVNIEEDILKLCTK